MANKILLKGFFGVKETFNISSTDLAATFVAGQLMVPTGSTALGTPSYIGDYVKLASVPGWPVLGVVMENSTDVVAGTTTGTYQPSGSKVTVLHGHSRFKIEGSSTTQCYEATVATNGYVGQPLFASSGGKWTNLSGSTAAQAIGMLTQKPSASNGYTLGVVLFG